MILYDERLHEYDWRMVHWSMTTTMSRRLRSKTCARHTSEKPAKFPDRL